jgi:hypothetical protein
MLHPQVIVNLLQQRGQQSALRTGRVGCRNVVSSVSHKALTSTTVSMRALHPKSDAAVPFRGVTLTKWLSAELLGAPVETLVRLFADARISGKRPSCL